LFVVDLKQTSAGNVGVQPIGSQVSATFTSLSPSNPYCRWIRRGDSKIWDGDSFETSPTWSSSAISITKGTYTKVYKLSVPSGIENGRYDIPLYDNSSPADTDVPIGIIYVNVWDGEFIDIFNL
jgi:hypothetical protein